MTNGIEAIRYLVVGKAVNFHYSFISDTFKGLTNSKIRKNNNSLQNYYATFVGTFHQ